MPTKDRLIFALDVTDNESAKTLVQELGDSVTFYKIGLELFMAGRYFELLAWLRDQGKKIFVDLKFFDVPKTVESAVKQLDRYGADFATVHGNDAIMSAAANSGSNTQILAVTALTSLDIGDMRDLGFQTDIESLVLSRAKRAFELGCAGVISSGLEVRKLRQHIDNKLLVVSPGVRPGYNDEPDDQKRTVTVTQAFENGADHIVVGRPIKNAPSPREAALNIQQEINGFFAQ